ncbi:MAG TPA: glyoxalase superfamily protein [Hymenobacter sp.]|jgi:catechol 2,3-dioxygenase-like lactoylglutathione lyase family enzyme
MVTPIFQILDYQKARDFYVDWLGFRIDWEDQGSKGMYMQVSRGDITLHLSSYQSDSCPGSKAMAEINGLLAYHRHLMQKHHPTTCPELKKTSWSEKVLQAEVVDPFGNRIVFVEACM